MKKKSLWIIPIILVVLLLISLGRLIAERNQYIAIAEEIYRVETALKKVDEDWKRDSITKISSFEIKGPDGVAGIYSCCQSVYFGDFKVDENGIDSNVIGQLIDLEQIETTQKLKVNEYNACIYTIEDQSFLCWTVSPKYSFAIQYDPQLLSEDSALRMAESVEIPEE